MDMNRLALIKAVAEKQKKKREEEAEFQASIQRLDARKAAKKEEMKLHKKLTQQVKKAGKDSPGSLDCFKEENMYYSDKDTERYLEGSSYMDAYNANKSADGEW
tara:strand:- start:879 stop:1190 length:312 start_codon:yes stop_codon:yes gene_type:complete